MVRKLRQTIVQNEKTIEKYKKKEAEAEADRNKLTDARLLAQLNKIDLDNSKGEAKAAFLYDQVPRGKIILENVK